MKKIVLLILLLLSTGIIKAQEKLSKEEQERRRKNIEAGNPFAKYGSKAPVATLSKGKYLEVHDLDSIVSIGSIRWHVENQQIVGRIIRDTLDLDAQPLGNITGRWMSPDPLSEEFPDTSPYVFVNDNPNRFTDPTGMAPEDEIDPPIKKDKTSRLDGWNKTVGEYNNKFNNKVDSFFRGNPFEQTSNATLDFLNGTATFVSDGIGLTDALGMKNNTRDAIGGALNTLASVPNMNKEQQGAVLGMAAIIVTEIAITERAPVKTGSFSILDWKGYPSGGVKPAGPFRLLEGAEYKEARDLANFTNAKMRRANPEKFKNLQIHEIHPVKFGGSPTELSNKISIPQKEHIQYTNYWNSLMKNANNTK